MKQSLELAALLRLLITSVVVASPFALIGAIAAGETGFLLGLIIGIAFFSLAYSFAGRIIVRVFDAEVVDATTCPEVVGIVEDLAARAGISVPKVALSRLGTPNAFAAHTPDGGVVGVTEPLLAILTPSELEAVLAHELSHLRRPARSVATTAALFAALPGALSIRWGCDSFYSERFRRVRKLGPTERRNQVFGFWCALPAALLVRLASPRQVEFEADDGAVELCGSSEQLVSALRKINSLAGRLVSPVNPALSHLLVVHPFSQTPLSRMFDAHPPMEQRIARLTASSDL